MPISQVLVSYIQLYMKYSSFERGIEQLHAYYPVHKQRRGTVQYREEEAEEERVSWYLGGGRFGLDLDLGVLIGVCVL